MGTIKQQRLAKAIVENIKSDKPLNKGQLLESSGYPKSLQEGNPGKIIEQKGVQEELIKMGFTEDNAKKVVTEIMNNPKAKDEARLKAADMTFKVHGTYAPEKNINLNLDVSINNQELEDLANRLNNLEKNAIHERPNLGSSRTSADPLDKEIPNQE